MASSSAFIPASLLLDDIGVWPADLAELDDGTSILDRVGVRDVGITETTGQTTAQFTIVFQDELALTIPGLSGIKLVFGGNGTESAFKFELDLREPRSLRLLDVSFALRFSSNMLKSVRSANGHFELDPSSRPVEIGVKGTIIVGDSGVHIEGMDELSLAPCMISDSGIIIEASSVILDLSRDSSIPAAQAAGLPLTWMGVFIERAAIHLPPELGSAVPSGLAFENCFIGSGGFTGQFEASWDPRPVGSIAGVEFSLKSIALSFRQNSFVRSELNGTLTLPFFDEPIDIDVGFTTNGQLSLQISDPTGLVELKKPGVLSVGVDAFGFEIGGVCLSPL